MERRELLGVFAAGAVALPGCVDGGGSTDTPADGQSNTGTDSPTADSPATDDRDRGTDTASPTPDPPDGTAESIEPGTAGEDFLAEAFVAPELVAPNSPDSFGVYGERDEQYVVAVLDAAEKPGPAVADVVLEADDAAYEATTDIAYGAYALFDYGGAYPGPDEPEGWVAFDVPKPLDVESATITWPDGEHTLSEDALAELATSPTSFEVQSVDAPESTTVGETVEATVTVENTGDEDGTFVFAVNRVGPNVAYAPETGVRLSIPAGETRRWTYEYTVDVYESLSESRPMTLHFVWRDDGGASREISVEPAGTPVGTATDADA